MPMRFRFVQICLAALALLEACSPQAPPSNDGVARFLSTLRQAREASQAKQWTEAASLWEEVTKENPVTGDFWLQLARARHNNQDYAGAITAYEKAMSLGVNGLRSDIHMKLPAVMPARVRDADRRQKKFLKPTCPGSR
jgi:cytochrome c-type biogenesis protein CcmH/NrfG